MLADWIRLMIAAARLPPRRSEKQPLHLIWDIHKQTGTTSVQWQHGGMAAWRQQARLLLALEKEMRQPGCWVTAAKVKRQFRTHNAVFSMTAMWVRVF